MIEQCPICMKYRMGQKAQMYDPLCPTPWEETQMDFISNPAVKNYIRIKYCPKCREKQLRIRFRRRACS